MTENYVVVGVQTKFESVFLLVVINIAVPFLDVTQMVVLMGFQEFARCGYNVACINYPTTNFLK